MIAVQTVSRHALEAWLVAVDEIVELLAALAVDPLLRIGQCLNLELGVHWGSGSLAVCDIGL